MKKRQKKILAITLCVVLGILALPPMGAVIIYESVFCRRHDVVENLVYRVEEFDDLSCTPMDFESDGDLLCGYLFDGTDAPKGIVVIAHGLGGGGYNDYLPMIHHFTQNGYRVFAYDAHGHGESDEYVVGGLPQGVIDLDNAICHVKEHNDLPILLLGHSWGGYSVGAVLNLHPDVEAAVILAGFNESEDLLLYQGQQYAGENGAVLMPFFRVYENLKFGRDYADLSALDGIAASDAAVLIVHSLDDETVPVDFGYDVFYENFGDDPRFQFLLYENKGHGYLYCSDEALAAQAAVESDPEKMDRDTCLALDPQLMTAIVELFDSSLHRG